MRHAERHYSEEEILVFLLDEAPGDRGEIRRHLAECSACAAVYRELGDFRAALARWRMVELPESVWAARKRELFAALSHEPAEAPRGAPALWRLADRAWNYALDNPLAALGYVAAAAAFASQQTITVFRLEHVLPATSQVIEIVRQVFLNG